jgi:hypothetical protein
LSPRVHAFVSSPSSSVRLSRAENALLSDVPLTLAVDVHGGMMTTCDYRDGL